MPDPLRILFIEDLPSDQELAKRQLRAGGLDFIALRVETETTFIQALDEFRPDVIISDYAMPEFDGMQALELTRKLHPEIPFIILTGSMNEDTAVECLKAGADDYVIKEHIHRLPFAVLEAIKHQKARQEKDAADRELRESEAKFRAIFNNNHIVMLLIDPDSGAIIDANQAAHLYYGWSIETLKGMKISDINTRSKEEVAGEMEKAKTLKRSFFEFRHRLANGEIRDVEVFSGPIQHKGQTLLYSVITDVSARKQTEQMLKLQSTALQSAANAIMITDLNGSIEWVNTAFTRLTGYAEQEVLGQNPRILKSGVQDDLFYKNLWDTILAGQVWKGELMNRRKDGRLYSEESTITPLIDSQGGITHFICIKVDITEQKIAENQLQQKRRLQEQIATLGRELAATLDLSEIYTVAQRNLKEMIDCPHFSISLIKPDKLTLETAFSITDGVVLKPSKVLSLRNNLTNTLSGRLKAISSKRPVIVNDLPLRFQEENDLINPVGSEKQLKSALFVPMVVGDQVIGLIDLRSYSLHAYAEQDGEWLSVVANQIGLAIQNANLLTQTQRRVDELQTLHNIDQIITSRGEPDTIYHNILKILTDQPHVDAVALWIYNPQNALLEYHVGEGFSNPISGSPKLAFGEGLPGKIALERQMVRILNPSEEIPGLMMSENWRTENFSGYVGLPLVLQQNILGVLEIFSRDTIPQDEDWLRFLNSVAHQFTIAIDDNQLFQKLLLSNRELIQAYNATIEGWSQAMDLRDKETEGHTIRVTEMTLSIARALGIKDDKMEHIRRGAMLHDIGKLGVPDNILLKPGPLTEEEWEVMRKHPVLAYEMLNPIDYLRPALSIPYCHHEKWDGSGYPRGLKGQQIPLEARIFALVDVFDALTSDRPYRKAWSRARTLEYIQEQSGKHFDPKIVAAFLSLCNDPRFLQV